MGAQCDGGMSIVASQATTTSVTVDGKEIVILTGGSLLDLKKLIREGNTHEFYVAPEWRRLRKEVLDEQKNECQEHKHRGGYHKANHVHHVNHLREHPELALSKWYMDKDGRAQQNLIAVCKECHETVCHPERLRKAKKQPWPERWD